jgi:DNA-binding LacI/PurR family transcriptional regulator
VRDTSATILDVARRAGVSYQTVSNVINGRLSQMRAETRTRVEQAMRELDFHPNQRARSLRRARSQVIGLLAVDPSVNFIAAPFTSQILAGVALAADGAGYALLVQALRPRGGERWPAAATFSRLFRERRIDGAVVYLSGPRAVRERYLAELAGRSCPFVLIQERFDGPTNACVLAGDLEGGFQAAAELIRRGHRTIGFLTEDTVWPALEARREGYELALARAGIAPDPTLVEAVPESAAAVGDAMGRLLARHPALTAVLCFNDLVAMGAMALLRERGIAVPEAFSVVGFDDFPFAGYLTPPLSTVRLLGFEVGRRSGELLVGRLESGGFAATETVFPSELVLRGSIGPGPAPGGPASTHGERRQTR